MRVLSVLGSTGSIGTQALDIVRLQKGDFQVGALAAGRGNPDLLSRQILEFAPELVAVPDAETASRIKELLQAHNAKLPEIVFGTAGLESAAAFHQADIVISGIVGAKGIEPTAAALKAGKTVALANKETLVAAGAYIMSLAEKYGGRIVPVDSEHSAIHQSMRGFCTKDLKRVLLTGSGGPFRTWTKEDISRATISDALKHPNWSMGKKITIDSATLMNKGLEIIEARWLFGIEAEKIAVLIHPQSILHSAVEFVDGSVIGQLGQPDMHLPIHYALYYPERMQSLSVPLLDLVKVGSLTFEEPDYDRFPCLALARQAANLDNTVPAVLNAANEVAVEAFLSGALCFGQIATFINSVIELHQAISNPSLDDILEADQWARSALSELLGAKAR